LLRWFAGLVERPAVYKHRSAAMQRFHKVHEIIPVKHVEDDYIPSAENMGLREVEAERTQIHIEMTRLEQELAIAKRQCRWSDVAFLGNKKSGMCSRMSILKQRRAQLCREDNAQALSQAVKELASEDLRLRIYARQKEIIEELKTPAMFCASADRSPEGQDTAGGLIEDESAVGAAETPIPHVRV
jgi:hypothetical protein